MQELSSRILNESEKGLIIDIDTIYMDTIARVLKVATAYTDFLNEEHIVMDKYQLIADMVTTLESDYVTLLFKEDAIPYVNELLMDSDKPEYIQFYNREDHELYTDFGFNLESFITHPITWFTCKEESNNNKYTPFENKEIVLDEINIETIIDIIKANNFSIIVVPVAEMVARLAAELKDITIVYPSYGCNLTETIPGAYFFKYHKALDTYEAKNKLEVAKYNPIGRYLKEVVAMG